MSFAKIKTLRFSVPIVKKGENIVEYCDNKVDSIEYQNNSKSHGR